MQDKLWKGWNLCCSSILWFYFQEAERARRQIDLASRPEVSHLHFKLFDFEPEVEVGRLPFWAPYCSKSLRQVVNSKSVTGGIACYLSVVAHVYWECLKAQRIQELPSRILEELCKKKYFSKISFPDARLLLLGQPPPVQLEPEQPDRLLEAGREWAESKQKWIVQVRQVLFQVYRYKHLVTSHGALGA